MRAGARPGPGVVLLALLPVLLALFALGTAAPAAVLVLRGPVAALLVLLLALGFVLLAARSAAGARSSSE